jgi:GMP synthase (glutamine-hydrolysing)
MVYIAVVSMGGQFNHLIARAVMDAGEEAEMVHMSGKLSDIEKLGCDGMIFGGGPQSIADENADLGNAGDMLRHCKVPALTMCLTHQLLAKVYGGKSGKAKEPEFGVIEIIVDKEDEIVKGMGPKFRTTESHNDEVLELPSCMEALAHSSKCRYQIIRHKAKPLFGLQFHPETMQGEKDAQVFVNFLDICKRHKK